MDYLRTGVESCYKKKEVLMSQNQNSCLFKSKLQVRIRKKRGFSLNY